MGAYLKDAQNREITVEPSRKTTLDDSVFVTVTNDKQKCSVMLDRSQVEELVNYLSNKLKYSHARP